MTTQRLDVVAPPARKEQTDVKFKQHSDEDMVQFNKRVRRATATAVRRSRPQNRNKNVRSCLMKDWNIWNQSTARPRILDC